MTNVFQPRFQNEDAAREHLEALHWPNGPFCPHCGSVKATRLPPQRGRKTKAHPEGAIRKGVVQCNDCRQQYTVTVGTVFESSKVPLHKWLYVNHVLCSSKKGTSAHQIARNIGVSYKTAWFMMHRIREAMKETHSGPMGGFGSTIEADETYVGGKVGNRNSKQQKRFDDRRSPIHGKQPVVSLVERGGNRWVQGRRFIVESNLTQDNPLKPAKSGRAHRTVCEKGRDISPVSCRRPFLFDCLSHAALLRAACYASDPLASNP